jgi:hypothetical protein
MNGGVLEIDGLPVRPTDELTQVVKLSFAGNPAVVKPRKPVRREVVIPVAADQATVLPAGWANVFGRSRKGYRHVVRELDAPDRGLDRLPAEFRPFGEDGRKVVAQWRAYQQKAVWQVECDRAMKVGVRVCLRVPQQMAGSTYEVRCGAGTLKSEIRGQAMPADWTPAPPDWFRGFHYMPFAWEDAGELDLPAGRSEIAMNPTWMPYGNFFCDVLGMELMP